MRDTVTFETGDDGSLILAPAPGEDAPFTYEELQVEVQGSTIEIRAPTAGAVTLEAVHGRRDR